jgi:hypothetical protein
VDHEENERAHHHDADRQSNQARSGLHHSHVAVPAAVGTVRRVNRQQSNAMAARAGRCRHVKW